MQQADGTLVGLSEAVADDEAKLKTALLLTDVMATGHHAAVCAGVGPGSTAVVVGDGAVGLCGVLTARRLGAERIVAVGHHDGRLEVARRFGATDTVDSAEPDAVERVLDLTGGGAASVLEAVGTNESFAFAVQVARPGGSLGWVGVPTSGRPTGSASTRRTSTSPGAWRRPGRTSPTCSATSRPARWTARRCSI